MKKLFTKVKPILLLGFVSLTFNFLCAQNVGVNATGATPDVSAMLDVATSNKGLLIPRIALSSTTDAVTIATPATSLLVYNTNSAMTNGQGVGYYYNSGTTIAPLWIKLTAANEAWLLKGNTGIITPTTPATYGTSTIGATENFLGTTDANDVVIGTNNIERFRIKQTTGYTGIGLANPFTKLNVSGGNWDVENGIGDFQVGDGTYRFKLGLANAGAGAGDVRMSSHGGTNRIFIGGGLNSEVVTVDGTNQRVGIKNNINPASVLDVAGDIALREGTNIAVAAGSNALTLTGEFSHYRLTGAGGAYAINTISGGNDGQYIILINNSNQSMTINNNNAANGILTGNNVNLVSDGTGNSAVSLIYNATLARWIVVSSAAMRDANDWHTTGNTAITSPAVPATYGTSTIGTTENWIGTTDNNDFTIGTNNIERMRVQKATGNVGIGIASPLYKLHVVDPTPNALATYSLNTYSGNADGVGVYGVSVNNPNWGYGAEFYGGYMGVYSNATLSGAGARYGGYFNGWYGATTNFGSYNYGYGGTTAYGIYARSAGGSTQSIGAYITGSNYGVIVPNTGGLSGFGTTAPEQRLSVYEGANIDQASANAGTTTNALTFGSGSGEGIGSNRTTAVNQYGLDFYSNFLNRMVITQTGLVGIGVTAPTARLHVYDQSAIYGDVPTFTAIRNLAQTAGSTWRMGSVEYYTEGYDNIGFTRQLCPIDNNGSANLGSTWSTKYDGFRWGNVYITGTVNSSSDIRLKENINPNVYGIEQLRKINPISYVFKEDRLGNGTLKPKEYRQIHIGFSAQELKQIIPEVVTAWDWISNNEDGYIKAKTSSLGVNYSEIIPITVNAIKELDKQQQEIIKTITISDFGMEQTKANEIRIIFSKEFKAKLQGNPIVTITALEPNASYYIANIDTDGFVIKNNNASNSMSFNWMAMAKVNDKMLEIQTNYSEEQHLKKLKAIEVFENSLPTSEEVIQLKKAKAEAAQNVSKQIISPDQQKAKEDAEKLRIKTKELEKKYEEDSKKYEAERNAKETDEKLHQNNSK